MEVDEAEREAVYEQRWADGGMRFMAAFNDLAVNQVPKQISCRFCSQQDPRNREGPCNCRDSRGQGLAHQH